jgi:hypothetical protein
MSEHIDRVIAAGANLTARMTPEQRALAVASPSPESVGKTQQAQLAGFGWGGAGFGGIGAFGFPAIGFGGLGFGGTGFGFSRSVAFGTGFGAGCGFGACGGVGFW